MPTRRPTKLLLRGGHVYDHAGDIHRPPVADVLVEGPDIVAVEARIDDERATGAEVIDASNHLVIPGFVNAHYHSHDTLARGLFEELPLELWLLLYTAPLSGNRSPEEVRLRTLVGALESVRCGITTAQDMVSLIPLNEAYLDVVVSAYEEIGQRVVLAPALADVPLTGMLCYEDALPREIRGTLGDEATDARSQLDFLERQVQRRRPAAGTLHWAVAPIAPQRCTRELLEGCAALAERHDLPVYSHVYETRGQALLAREKWGAHGGSFIRYLQAAGLLGPRLTIAHSVWISPEEIALMVEAGAGAVLNHVSNMKLKSGIAPLAEMREAGLRLALGCDNCSGSDVQNMFQAMKMYCLISAVSDPVPGPGLAGEAMRLATAGGAGSALLGERLGSLTPGRKADLVLLDLDDPAYLPYSSAARQLVYTETGRSIDTVIVDGRVVMRGREILTIDEAALREAVREQMQVFTADLDALRRARAPAAEWLAEHNRRVWSTEIGLDRLVPRLSGS